MQLARRGGGQLLRHVVLDQCPAVLREEAVAVDQQLRRGARERPQQADVQGVHLERSPVRVAAQRQAGGLDAERPQNQPGTLQPYDGILIVTRPARSAEWPRR